MQYDNGSERLPPEHLNAILGFPGSYWINSHLISLAVLYKDPADVYSRGFISPQLFDPFAGNWVDEPLQMLRNRLMDGKVGFSPDMSRALYEARSGDYVAGIVLLDLTSDTIIWSDPEFIYNPSSLIQWAPDSSKVVVSSRSFSPGYDRVLLLSQDGDKKVIADQTFSKSEFGISALSWSLNSRYLALIIGTSTYNYLFLYDSTLDHYIYRCPLFGFDNYSPAPVWSPDGTYIALSTQGSGFPLQILNVKTGEIVDLVKDAFVVGWSDKFPSVWP